jgi:hypothetical protein
VISGKANSVLFLNSSFIEFHNKGLLGLEGFNASSEMVFENVGLFGPSPGSLLTSFPNLTFTNVTAEYCSCGLLRKLMVDEQSPNDELTSPLTMEKDLVINNCS